MKESVNAEFGPVQVPKKLGDISVGIAYPGTGMCEVRLNTK